MLVPRLSWAEEGTPERRQGNDVGAADSGCMAPYDIFRAEPPGAFWSPILPWLVNHDLQVTELSIRPDWSHTELGRGA